MDTGDEVTVLGAEVYNRLQVKPPRPEAGGYVAGLGWLSPEGLHSPFDVKAGKSARQLDLCVAPLTDSMLLGMEFPTGPQSQTGPGCRDLLLGGVDYTHDLGPEPCPPGGSSDSD